MIEKSFFYNECLASFIERFKSRFKVCPLPKYWTELYELLEANNSNNIDIPPPIYTSNRITSDTTQEKHYELMKNKQERFFLHIKITYEIGISEKIYLFLIKLDMNRDFDETYNYYMGAVSAALCWESRKNWLINQDRVFYDLVMKMELKYKNNENVRTVWGNCPIPEEWNSLEIDADIVLEKFSKFEETGTMISWDIILPWDNDEGFTRDKIINSQQTLIGIYDVDIDLYSWLYNEKLEDDYMGAWRVLLTEGCENSEPLEFKIRSIENKNLNKMLSLTSLDQ